MRASSRLLMAVKGFGRRLEHPDLVWMEPDAGGWFVKWYEPPSPDVRVIYVSDDETPAITTENLLERMP